MAIVASEAPTDNSLLLVTHVSLKRDDGILLIDSQTAAGIDRWTEHFSRVTYCGIEVTPDQESLHSTNWVNVAERRSGERCRLIALPNAYRFGEMITHYSKVRSWIAGELPRHEHLCFTLGGLVGDWPALAALEAIRQKRRYAAWFDSVESIIIRRTLSSAPLRRRIKEELTLPLMELYHRFLLRRSSVALLQGAETLGHYGRWSNNAHCIYDTHTVPSDFISETEIVEKQKGLLSGRPLRIVYAGRALDIKGPLDWVEALAILHDRGVLFEGIWLGDGPMLDDMKRHAAKRGILGKITFKGFVADQKAVLDALRKSDLFLFCHKTAESPRCLIESLVCGCPIIGYAGAYAKELTRRGGGAFVRRGDVNGLAELVESLSRDRRALADLVNLSAVTGRNFDESSVYAHRANLMKVFA